MNKDLYNDLINEINELFPEIKSTSRNSKNFSDETVYEIIKYFRGQKYSSKRELYDKTEKHINELLKDCEFVYIAENGKVIHSIRYCGGVLCRHAHIEQAIKHGYNRMCPKCGAGSYAEVLFNNYNNIKT